MENIKAKEKFIPSYFTDWRPVQKEVIPALLEGKDMIVKAPTGSGKSHAFLIPLAQLIEINNHKGLIIAPTKEIALQLKSMLQELVSFKIGMFIGGMDDGLEDIIVATPGRLIIALENGLSLKSYSKIIIDEVEMIADESFLHQLDYILKRVAPRRQIAAFGAVINSGHKRYLKARMNNPLIIDSADKLFFKQINNYLISVRESEKLSMLGQLLNTITPSIALIFASSNLVVDQITMVMTGKYVKVNSELNPRERARLLLECRQGKYQYIISSDLFSRGIDIPGVSDVINYDIPQELSYFYHRIGRTGRIAEGNSFTFYSEDQLTLIKQLDKRLRFKPIKIKDNQIVTARAIFRPRKNNVALNEKIKQEVRRVKKGGPCHKKKARVIAEKIKKEHRRQIIRENIKKKYE